MTTELIDKLLNKYFDGDTSLEEENILRGYFLNENINASFVKYIPLFIFLNNEKNVESNVVLINKNNAFNQKKDVGNNNVINKSNAFINEKNVENNNAINKNNAFNQKKNVENNNAINKNNAFNHEKTTKKTIVKMPFYWLKIAASVAFLALGSWFIATQFKRGKSPQIAENQLIKKKAKVIILDENADPELAFAAVEKALLLMSKNMKKGTDETTESLQKIKAATKVINQ